jgi:transposase
VDEKGVNGCNNGVKTQPVVPEFTPVFVVPIQQPPGRARSLFLLVPPLQPYCADWRALDARLDPHHPARLLAAALGRLDLQPLNDAYAGRGGAAYPPRLLLAAALYEIHHGQHSPAVWCRHAKESDPLRWLLRGFTPSRSCWYDFRDRLGPAVLALAQQAVERAIAEGFTAAERGALDGTTLAANSTRHKLLNEATLTRRLEHLAGAVRLDETPPADAAGPAADMPQEQATPAETPPRWLAPTVVGRKGQLARYQRAAQQMKQRQARNRGKRKSKRTAAGKILVSPGDPEAILGRDKEKVFRPLYNAQLLADLDSPLILAYDVVAQANDAGLLAGLLGQAKEGLGHVIKEVVADSAYAGGQDLAEAKAQGTTVYAPWQANDYSQKKEAKYYKKEQFAWSPAERAYVCPAGAKLTYQGSSRQRRSGTERIELHMYKAQEATCQGCPKRQECTSAKGGRSISRSEYEEDIEELRQRMQGEEAKALYRLRKQVVERLNADIKQHRGLRRLSGRGLKRARTQLGLVVLAHNLMTLEKLRQRAEGVAGATPSPTTG